MKLLALMTACLTAAAALSCSGGGSTATKSTKPEVADPPSAPASTATNVADAAPAVADTVAKPPPTEPARVSNATPINSFPATTPKGFAESDLLAIESFKVDFHTVHELAFYSLADGKVTETMRLGFPKLDLNWDGVEWLNRNTLILLFTAKAVDDEENEDEKDLRLRPIVVRVTSADMTVLPVPGQDYFKLPKPKPHAEGNEPTASPVEDRLTVTPSGELWWSECPWGEDYDAGYCFKWVHARILPKAKKTVTGETIAARSWSWSGKAPAGYSVKEVEDDAAILLCKFKKQKSELTSPEGDQFVSAHWVSKKPPRLLVEWGSEGFGTMSASSWSLHPGCSEPIATGTGTQVGPNQLWIGFVGEESTEAEVYAGATNLGPLNDAAHTVMFRPLK